MTTVCYNVLQYTCTYVTYMLHQSVSLTRQHNLFLEQHTCARCCSHEYISKQRASVGRLLRYLFLPCPYPVLTSTEQESCNHNVNKHNLQLISIPGLEKKTHPIVRDKKIFPFGRVTFSLYLPDGQLPRQAVH